MGVRSLGGKSWKFGPCASMSILLLVLPEARVQTDGHHPTGGWCPAHGLCHGSGFQAEIPPWLCSLGCKGKAEFRGKFPLSTCLLQDHFWNTFYNKTADDCPFFKIFWWICVWFCSSDFGKPREQRHFPAMSKMCCWRICKCGNLLFGTKDWDLFSSIGS